MADFNLSNREEKVASKTIVFDGTSGKGAVGNIPLFTVIGDVLLRIYATTPVGLTSSGGTITVGTANNTAGILASIAASNLVTNDIFVSGSSPADVATIQNSYTAAISGSTITATVATAAITAGTLKFYCTWRPMSPGASVVAA